MASNDSFFQKKKPAAVLKHAVLGEYFSVFCSMVGSRASGPVWLIDGYAGPGAYEADDDGEKVTGSPIVALEIAERATTWNPSRDVRCAFIEQKADFLKKLQENVKPFQDAGRHALLLGGEVSEQLPKVWGEVGSSPVLTLLDPFGVSMDRDMMTNTLLARKDPPTEVLLNINLEAVTRHGGFLQLGASGKAEIKPHLVGQSKGVEKTDRFFGGEWWRDRFVEVREQTDSAADAAASVIDDYRAAIHKETGSLSISVPIRRRSNGPPLFLLTLFFRHDAAGYKFADAAARASKKWREAYRQQDLDDFFSGDEGQSMLPTMDAVIREDSEARAKDAEAQMDADNLAEVTANLISLLVVRDRIQIAHDVVEILGTALSLAGEPTIRKAWDQLADAGVVEARDKKQKNLWRQVIVRQ
ncbi:MAG TPA: three-Cys-motif partner protein TcmP [Mycobacteriales bacterium]|nr:three-Cys-motif partner protein TcmP [Mycobacteriales bacterium]